MASVFSSKDYISVTTFLLILPEVDLNFIITVWMFISWPQNTRVSYFRVFYFVAADAYFNSSFKWYKSQEINSIPKI